jgi:hypothetical protein
MRNPEPKELKDLQGLRNSPVLHFLQARLTEAQAHLIDADTEKTVWRLQGQAQVYRELTRFITQDYP